MTKQKPWGKEERKTAIFLPKDKKPRAFEKDNSWVICDMPYHVSLRKLIRVNDEDKIVDALIDREIYREVIRKYKEIIADDIV